jgi:glycerol dehydrogenase-like iron-containing ADH family enzyme
LKDSEKFPLAEGSAVAVLSEVGPYTLVASDPPWSSLAPLVPPPARLIEPKSVEVASLDRLLVGEPSTEVVVGLGGGLALDTAKYIAWKTGKRLVQVLSIASVDAGFTKAIGVRVDRKVSYVGGIVPEAVVLDIDLVGSAPPHLNRAGIGDVLSCHTGLFDWRLAADRGEGVPWDETYAAQSRELLRDLATHTDEIRMVTSDAIRWLVSAYRTIGALCGAAGHSRFEEGSEHFLAYAYEHLTGKKQVHGELVSMCAVAVATLQQNDPENVRRIVTESGTRANPMDLGIDRVAFSSAVAKLPNYTRSEGLDFSIVQVADLNDEVVDEMWGSVVTLPRRES